MPLQDRRPLLHRILEHPFAYSLNQMLNPWTVTAYHDFVKNKVRRGPETRILDVGCGVGANWDVLMPCRYTGIDINPAYIFQAERRHGGNFLTMDAGSLTFGDASFDAAVSVATCHHLSDQTIRAMVSDVKRVLAHGGIFHVIDPVLPASPNAHFKRWLFEHDRGQHQRTRDQMLELFTPLAEIIDQEVVNGPMHDVVYLALV
jgi:SAM-dependent methyltransferase